MGLALLIFAAILIAVLLVATWVELGKEDEVEDNDLSDMFNPR